MMTYFLQDILRQPKELRAALDFLAGPAGPGWMKPQPQFVELATFT